MVALAARILLMGSVCASLAGADPLPRSILDMARAKQHNRELLKHVPMYTCLETIWRELQAPKQKKPEQRDVVQLDVGIGARQEIYSWPGEPTFSSGDLAGLVGQGLLATGIFDTFARNIFIHDSAIVLPAGRQMAGGRELLHFTYSMPSMANSWNVDWLGAQGSVGEAGEFWVDAETLTLLRLNVSATNFPPNLPLSALTVGINYQTVAIADMTALIPSSAKFTATEINGTVHRDEMTFSQCRVFRAESKISDSPQLLQKAVENYEAHREALPAGLELPITLETAIRAGTAKLGDALTAHLDKAVKISPQSIVPRGTLVKGRIREFVKLNDPPETYQIGLEFNELDWPGHAGVFFGEASSIQPLAGLSTFIAQGSSRSVTTLAGLETTSSTERMAPAAVPGVATFFLSNFQGTPKGFKMVWKTHKVRHL